MQTIENIRANQHSSLQALFASVYDSNTLIHEKTKSIYQAIHSRHWKAVIEEEYSALQINKTWSIVELPPGWIPIVCKWIFKVNKNANGSIARYKGSLVSKVFFSKTCF